MKVVAVIPARGGSVGLPRKNVRPFNGVPLVGRTIEVAIASGVIDRVYVSSDSVEILNIATLYGAGTIRRPDAISDGGASSESALMHAMECIEATEGRPEFLFFLQCTSPFTTVEHIRAVYSGLIERGAAAAFSAVEDHGFIWKVGSDGWAQGVTHDHSKPRERRQDMAPRYRENGAIYAMRVNDFMHVGSRFCGPTILVPVDAPAVEIDSNDDWLIAEAIALKLEADRRPVTVNKQIRALVTDFDGVHTDDRVLVGEDGQESVFCSRSDGMGIEHLRAKGLKLLILSREQNHVVETRAKKLQVAVLHHVLDKLSTLDCWRIENGLAWDQIAYVGNDVNDLECMMAVGLSFAPSDGHPEARRAASFVLGKPGGRGALREVSEFLIARQLIA